jgi:hypothetical protein
MAGHEAHFLNGLAVSTFMSVGAAAHVQDSVHHSAVLFKGFIPTLSRRISVMLLCRPQVQRLDQGPLGQFALTWRLNELPAAAAATTKAAETAAAAAAAALPNADTAATDGSSSLHGSGNGGRSCQQQQHQLQVTKDYVTLAWPAIIAEGTAAAARCPGKRQALQQRQKQRQQQQQDRVVVALPAGISCNNWNLKEAWAAASAAAAAEGQAAAPAAPAAAAAALGSAFIRSAAAAPAASWQTGAPSSSCLTRGGRRRKSIQQVWLPRGVA